jgi:hypothetical protein
VIAQFNRAIENIVLIKVNTVLTMKPSTDKGKHSIDEEMGSTDKGTNTTEKGKHSTDKNPVFTPVPVHVVPPQMFSARRETFPGDCNHDVHKTTHSDESERFGRYG